MNNFSEFGPNKAIGDFGSVDSSEFLGTRAFPSQGSLANMELLAAQGSMGPNGWINNSVYVNPFEPGRDGRRRQLFRESPGSPRRRKRLSVRSRSTDLAEFEATTQETCLREGRGPKHKRPRGYQVNNPMICHAMIRQNSGQNSFDKIPILGLPGTIFSQISFIYNLYLSSQAIQLQHLPQ